MQGIESGSAVSKGHCYCSPLDGKGGVVSMISTLVVQGVFASLFATPVSIVQCLLESADEEFGLKWSSMNYALTC